jgi:hypothetical protein
MLSVPIVYDDGTVDQVDPRSLQILIEEEMIVKFQRREGWAYIGSDPIRRSQRDAYSGLERRQLH